MRAWAYAALAFIGCHIGTGDDSIDGPIATMPDPNFKWVGAFPSYTATEMLSVPNPNDIRNPGTVFAPAAVGSDGSFISYAFLPTNVLLPVATPYSSIDAALDTSPELGLVTSLTYVNGSDASYVATTDNPYSQQSFQLGVSTTSTATFASDVAFVEDMYSPIPTAVAFDGSQAYVFKSEREPPLAFLNSKGLIGSADDIPALASQLAGSGYVITAFGQLDDVPTYGLVGVYGPATDAIVAQSFPGTGTGSAIELFAAGYVPVGGYVQNGATYFIFEK
jgi:hypothetical protein